MHSHVIDASRDQMDIMCRQSRKILRFSLIDGSFIEKVHMKNYGYNYELLNSQNYIIFTRGRGAILQDGSPDLAYIIFIVDRETQEIKRKYFPGESNLFGLYPFMKTDEGFKLHLPYNDTIYSLSSDTVSPAYVVDFGSHSIPPEYFYLSMEEQRKYDRNSFSCLSDVIESEKYLFMHWAYKNLIRWHLWSKKSEKGINFRTLYDDIDGLERYISFKRPVGNKFVATYESLDILEQENIKETRIYQKLIEKGWIADEESNPVIALYEINFK